MRRRLPLVLLATAGLVLPASIQTARADALWRGDYETGNFSQWTTLQGPRHNATIVTDLVRQGRYAARFRVGPDDKLSGSSGERSEVYASTGESAGTESWWGWSTYFGDDFNPTPNSFWNIFTQWHNSGTTGQANVHFEVDTTVTPWQIQLRSFGGLENQNERRFRLFELRRNRWFDFVFHVRWASDNTGFLELWVDGQLVLPRTFTPTLYAGQSVYLKQGFYRAPSNVTSVLYHDRMRRGDSYAAVAPRQAEGAAASTPSTDLTRRQSLVGFIKRPRLVGRHTLALTARAPRGRQVHIVVRGPRGRVLGSTWTHAGRRGRVKQRIPLPGLWRQRVLRVTLTLPARPVDGWVKTSSSVRATATVIRSRRDPARADRGKPPRR
jgi:hypothetical protein